MATRSSFSCDGVMIFLSVREAEKLSSPHPQKQNILIVPVKAFDESTAQEFLIHADAF